MAMISSAGLELTQTSDGGPRDRHPKCRMVRWCQPEAVNLHLQASCAVLLLLAGLGGLLGVFFRSL